MANYKKYPIIGATNYEVTHDGKVFNIKKNKEISIQNDGRVKIVGNDGKQKRITPHIEYNKAKTNDEYETKRTITKKDPVGNEYTVVKNYINYFTLAPLYPNYFIDRNAMIYHVNNPYIPLSLHYGNRVMLSGPNGIVFNRNRFKLYAIHVLGVPNPSQDYKNYVRRMIEEEQLTLNNMKYRTKEFYESKNMIYNTVEDWQVEEDDLLLEEMVFIFKDIDGNKRFITEGGYNA